MYTYCLEGPGGQQVAVSYWLFVFGEESDARPGATIEKGSAGAAGMQAVIDEDEFPDVFYKELTKHGKVTRLSVREVLRNV